MADSRATRHKLLRKWDRLAVWLIAGFAPWYFFPPRWPCVGDPIAALETRIACTTVPEPAPSPPWCAQLCAILPPPTYVRTYPMLVRKCTQLRVQLRTRVARMPYIGVYNCAQLYVRTYVRTTVRAPAPLHPMLVHKCTHLYVQLCAILPHLHHACAQVHTIACATAHKSCPPAPMGVYNCAQL